MEFLRLGFKVLNGSSRYAIVVSVAIVVVCVNGCCRFMWLVGRTVTHAPNIEPSYQRLHKDGEEEGREGIAL